MKRIAIRLIRLLYGGTRNWKRWKHIAKLVTEASDKKETGTGNAYFDFILSELSLSERCLKKCVLRKRQAYNASKA